MLFWKLIIDATTLPEVALNGKGKFDYCNPHPSKELATHLKEHCQNTQKVL